MPKKDDVTYFNGKPVRQVARDTVPGKTPAQREREIIARGDSIRAVRADSTARAERSAAGVASGERRQNVVRAIARRVLPKALQPGEKVKKAGDKTLGR